MSIDRELALQAHDLLHKGDVAGAHEVLHKMLGLDNEAPTAKPIGQRSAFDMAFITACRKNGVRAAYVLIDEVGGDGRARLLSGGDAQLCGVVDQAMRAKP